MRLFGPIHLCLLAVITLICVALSVLCRRRQVPARAVRLAIGWGIIVNELIWWAFRYSHEGLHLWNLPFQLCDVTLWMSAFACLTLNSRVVEFAYFGGLAGAGMALRHAGPLDAVASLSRHLLFRGARRHRARRVGPGLRPHSPAARRRGLAGVRHAARVRRQRSARSTRWPAPTSCTCAASRRARRSWIRSAPGRITWWPALWWRSPCSGCSGCRCGRGRAR